MLDEGTAAAEAMTLLQRVGKSKSNVFFVADDVLPQTIDVVRTRAEPLGHRRGRRGPAATVPRARDCFGVLLQYPGRERRRARLSRAGRRRCTPRGALVVVAADLLALTLLAPPGEWGADVVVGSSQRFGVPLGFGGPHAAYFATRDEFKRSMPGRLVGVSRRRARASRRYRLALQTREQHIRREKATSNICTAQVLLAVMAAMYAVYHGPEGLRSDRAAGAPADRHPGRRLAGGWAWHVVNDTFFDTLTVATGARTDEVHARAERGRINLRHVDATHVGISLDETTTPTDVALLWQIFAPEGATRRTSRRSTRRESTTRYPAALRRQSAFLDAPGVQPLPHRDRDAALPARASPTRTSRSTASMIPLGLVHDEAQRHGGDDPGLLAASSPHIHPFAPPKQTRATAR